MTFFSFYARKGIKKMVFNVPLGGDLILIVYQLALI